VRRVVQELDVRGLPSPQRPTATVRRFDSLTPGEALVLLSDGEPKTVLFALQEQRRQAFDWSVLEARPGCYRVEVRRRPAAEPRGVLDYLGWDHRRLDGLLVETVRSLKRDDRVAAAARFAEFWCGVGRHAEMEEQILLPAFERVTGEGGNPLLQVYSEHETIHRLSGEIAAALPGGDRGAVITRVEAVRELLEAHGLREERVLYPLSDRLAGDERGRADLISWMQAL
jgi:uncharacterized protein (DUF2249 family)